VEKVHPSKKKEKEKSSWRKFGKNKNIHLNTFWCLLSVKEEGVILTQRKAAILSVPMC